MRGSSDRPREDDDDVCAALANGSMNGKEHSPSEIEELKESGLFKKRYRNFLRTKTFTAKKVKEGMQEWLDKGGKEGGEKQGWLKEKDGKLGCKLGYSGARETVELQMAIAEEWVDTEERAVPKRKGPRDKHGCKKWHT